MTMETRAIKFRAWDPTTQQMYMDCLVGNKGKLIALEYEYDCGDITTSYATDTNGNYPESFKLMQYIGLKDKNGVEAYEGDIAKTKYQTKAEIVWHKEFACFCFKTIDAELKNDYQFTFKSIDIEIIGNIYENPELL